MTNRNKFYLMDKSEAAGFILEAFESWCNVYGDDTARIKECVEILVNNYNRNNVLAYEIDCYDYSYEGFNDGYPVGLGIEDDYIVFPEYREELEEYRAREF